MSAFKFGFFYGIIFAFAGIIVAISILLYMFGELPFNVDSTSETFLALFTVIQFILFGGYFGSRAAKHSAKKPDYSITNGLYWSLQLLVVPALVFDFVLLIYWVINGTINSQFTVVILLFIPLYTTFCGAIPAFIIGSIFGYVMKREFRKQDNSTETNT